MKLILYSLFFFLLTTYLVAREKGETEITTEDGIEVFQNEKYYILKKNVKIESDSFILSADYVKINFDKSLYDIVELNAKGKVNFNSQQFEMKGIGEALKFRVKSENLKIEGLNSKLISEDIEMFSDGSIEVNNLDGNFILKGLNSKLINESIIVEGESIDGIFSNIQSKKEITSLIVIDKEISYVKNDDTEMYAKKINYNDENAIIELIDNVSIIRNEEKITGDYGTLDTKNNSYKIKSNDKTKVKAIIQNNEQ